MVLPNGENQTVTFRRGQESQHLERVGGKTTQMPQPKAVSALTRHRVITAASLTSDWNETARRRQKSAVPEVWRVAEPKPTGLAEGYKKICERWSLNQTEMAMLLHLEEERGLSELILSGQVSPMTGDLKDRMALVIGISIGLGELFDDDKDAELAWLNSRRAQFNGASALQHMLEGDFLHIRQVVELLDRARGLK